MAKHQFAVYGNFEDLHQNVSAGWSVTIQLNWISLAALFDRSPEDRQQRSYGCRNGLNPVGKPLITANVLFRVNDAGLHSKPVPLIGVSYSF